MRSTCHITHSYAMVECHLLSILRAKVLSAMFAQYEFTLFWAKKKKNQRHWKILWWDLPAATIKHRIWNRCKKPFGTSVSYCDGCFIIIASHRLMSQADDDRCAVCIFLVVVANWEYFPSREIICKVFEYSHKIHSLNRSKSNMTQRSFVSVKMSMLFAHYLAKWFKFHL